MISRMPLGSTDMEISRVGIGLRGISPTDLTPTVRHAAELGVNWIDTAGLGESELRIAECTKGLPADVKPLVFTKCGLVWDGGDISGMQRLGDATTLREQCDRSLRQLGVERLDLLQMWWPPLDGTPVEEYVATFVALKDDGKIRAFGLSNHSLDDLQRAEKVSHVDVLQAPFSALRRDSAIDLIPWCEANGTAVICYSPMESGLLAGAFPRDRLAALPAADPRHRLAAFTSGSEQSLELVERLKPVAARNNISLAELAVSWVLSWPGVTGAIVGARSIEHVDGWIGGATLRLHRDEIHAIAAAIDDSAAGSGPSSHPGQRTRDR